MGVLRDLVPAERCPQRQLRSPPVSVSVTACTSSADRPRRLADQSPNEPRMDGAVAAFPRKLLMPSISSVVRSIE